MVGGLVIGMINLKGFKVMWLLFRMDNLTGCKVILFKGIVNNITHCMIPKTIMWMFGNQSKFWAITNIRRIQRSSYLGVLKIFRIFRRDSFLGNP